MRGRRYVKFRRIYGCKRTRRRCRSAAPVGQRSPPVAGEALQYPHGTGLSLLDSPLYPCQWHASSARDGRCGGGALPSDLARRDCVAPSTQNQALSALLFLYREVLALDLPWMENVVRAKRAPRLPVVLSRGETATLLRMLSGREALMAGVVVWQRLAADGMLAPSREGCGSSAQRADCPRGQGRQGSADDAACSAACRDAGAVGSDHYQALIQSQYGPAMPAGAPLINRLSMMRSRSEAARRPGESSGCGATQPADGSGNDEGQPDDHQQHRRRQRNVEPTAMIGSLDNVAMSAERHSAADR